ncbi:hypothetical protein GCM10027569_89480 [Flindersiella endophytica]
MVIGPALLGLAGYLVRIGRPALWIDEAATVNESSRSLGDLFEFLTHRDVGLGAYYLFMHAWLGLGDGVPATEIWARLPSAVAMALAVLLVADLARRWWGLTSAATAGVLLAASPVASRYAQEARPYALALLLAVLAVWLLVRAAGQRRWSWWLAYSVVIALLGLVHLVALLTLVAHPLLLIAQRERNWKQWLFSVLDGLILPVVLAVIAFRQREQIAWIPKPTLEALGNGYLEIAGGLTIAVLLGVAAVVGIAGNREWLGLVVWFGLPPLLLGLLGLLTPIFLPRYLVVCTPALILLAAAGVRKATWWQAALVCVLAAGLAVPQLWNQRQVDGHGPDVRSAAAVIARGCPAATGVREGAATPQALPYYLRRERCEVKWVRGAPTGDIQRLWVVRPSWAKDQANVPGYAKVTDREVPGLKLSLWSKLTVPQ